MPTPTLSDVLNDVVSLVTLFDGREDEMRNWWAGTVTGGYNQDGTVSDGVAPHGGYYPMTNSAGVTAYFPSIALLKSLMLKGDPGVDAGIRYIFSNSHADADPTSGYVAFDNATLASVTHLYFSIHDKTGADLTAWLNSLDDSNSTTKATIVFNQGSTGFALFAVTGAVVDATGYVKVPVSYVGSSGSFTAASDVIVAAMLNGNTGSQGIQGPQGNPGTNGTNGTNGAPGPAAWQTPAAWSTGQNYTATAPASLVTQGGQTYLCLVTHTSGVFGTDLGAGKWILVAAKGADGSGTGSVVPTGTIFAGQLAMFADSSGNVIEGASIGATNPTDILNRTSGDARYRPITYVPTKADVGLGNVDNTSDANKPVSTAQQTALNAKLDASAYVKASTAQAQAMTDDATYMTPVKVKSAIAARGTRQSIPVLAQAWVPAKTNGPALNQIELATNKVQLVSLDFDATTQQFAQFRIPAPKNADLTSFTFVVRWSHATTTTNFGVTWQLQAMALSDLDAEDVAWGAAQLVQDTGGTADMQYVTAESAALFVANTATSLDTIVFRVARAPADANDTMGVNARLEEVIIYYNTTTDTEA